jgi:hypothetical protein
MDVGQQPAKFHCYRTLLIVKNPRKVRHNPTLLVARTVLKINRFEVSGTQKQMVGRKEVIRKDLAYVKERITYDVTGYKICYSVGNGVLH